MQTFATMLTSGQVEQIHQASLQILEEVGILVRNTRAREIYLKHGCRQDSDSHVIKFPAAVIEEYRKLAPPTFTFYARDPQYDRTLPNDRPVIITASSAPYVIDPVTGDERRARSDDIARIAHLINELPNYDVFSISTLADDAPEELFTTSRLYPALKNCVKPVRTNTPDRQHAENILKLVSIIAGSEEAYREHPFVTTHFCPVVSPLTMDYDSTEMLIFFTEKKLPVYPSIVPNAGLSSPMSLSGTLAQCNAEFLATAALMQMVVPGTPLIYATLPTVGDLRTGAYASGGIECGMLHMACSQMARYYNVPSGGYVGLTNAKINDAQSGYETGMSVTAALLGGADMFNMGGLLDALKAFDFAKAVIDDEIAEMLKRIKRGFEFSPEEMALDVIAETGPGGNFMMHDHTVQRMRTTGILPKLADRQTRDGWLKKGGLDTHNRAMQRARRILARDNPVVFSAELDAKIHATFPKLVAGDAVLPEGW